MVTNDQIIGRLMHIEGLLARLDERLEAVERTMTGCQTRCMTEIATQEKDIRDLREARDQQRGAVALGLKVLAGLGAVLTISVTIVLALWKHN
jgi:hypothetical protein